jgi:hypothetical protein
VFGGGSTDGVVAVALVGVGEFGGGPPTGAMLDDPFVLLLLSALLLLLVLSLLTWPESLYPEVKPGLIAYPDSGPPELLVTLLLLSLPDSLLLLF